MPPSPMPLQRWQALIAFAVSVPAIGWFTPWFPNHDPRLGPVTAVEEAVEVSAIEIGQGCCNAGRERFCPVYPGGERPRHAR